jgi:hypothetical protein
MVILNFGSYQLIVSNLNLKPLKKFKVYSGDKKRGFQVYLEMKNLEIKYFYLFSMTSFTKPVTCLNKMMTRTDHQISWLDWSRTGHDQAGHKSLKIPFFNFF